MKYQSRYYAFTLGSLVVALSGCKSIDKSPFNDLSTAGDKMVQGTTDTYTGVQTILRAKQVSYLMGQDAPPWVGDNRNELFRPNLIDPDVFDARLKMAQALSGYAKKLATLADGPDYQKFDASAQAVANSLAGFDTDALAKLGFPTKIPFSKDTADDAANIVSDVAHLIMAEVSKHELKHYIEANEVKIDKFTALLAADIGQHTDDKGRPTDGIRALYYKNIYAQLQVAAGDTNEWSKGDAARTTLVNKSFDLADELRTQDASLVALQKAYLQFAIVNHQLIKTVADSESFDAAQAVSVLNGLVDHITALTKSLK